MYGQVYCVTGDPCAKVGVLKSHGDVNLVVGGESMNIWSLILFANKIRDCITVFTHVPNFCSNQIFLDMVDFFIVVLQCTSYN